MPVPERRWIPTRMPENRSRQCRKKNRCMLFPDGLRDIYQAERKILKALPKMARAAEDPEPRSAFQRRKEEAQSHVARLKEVFDLLGTAALRDFVRMGKADGAGPDRPDPVADAVGGGGHRQDPGRDRGVVRERGGESRLKPTRRRPSAASPGQSGVSHGRRATASPAGGFWHGSRGS
jgi:hypothetical protein